jgi:hypothetical protein
MRSFPRLGAANLAVNSFYFAPVWGADAVRTLTSRYSGFDDRVHAAVANYFRQVFDLGLDGLVRTSNVLAGIKLVIAAGFVAYLIEFARSLVMRRDVDRGTHDVVLTLAVAATAIWAVPALALDDAGLIRLHATQVLLIAGAIVVIIVERHIEQSAPTAVSRVTTAAHERDAERSAMPAELTSGAAGASLHRVA